MDERTYAKTSGSRGLHVFVPLAARDSYDEIAAFSRRVAQWIAQENPDATTLVLSFTSRKRDPIYIDYLQNAQGKTIVAPYSVRERPGATVSAPLTWDELDGRVAPQDFDIKTISTKHKPAT